MKEIYKKFNKESFKRLNIASCFFADIFVAIYLYLTFSDKKGFDEIFKLTYELMVQTDPQSAQVLQDPQFKTQLFSLLILTLLSLIAFYLVIHIIVYVLRWYDKDFAKGYITFYCWSAGILMSLFALLGITNLKSAMFLIPGLLLLFNANGMSEFKNAEE